MNKPSYIFKGVYAQEALDRIAHENGDIFTITPLKGGETLWYRLPNGAYCSVDTNHPLSPAGVGGENGVRDFGKYIRSQVEFLAVNNCHFDMTAIQQAPVTA